jgi:predicted XRE-type DNA-binding protein
MIAKGRRVANPPPLARPWKVDSGVMATVVALRAQGCTQAQIAAEVGLSQPYVSKLLRRVL